MGRATTSAHATTITAAPPAAAPAPATSMALPVTVENGAFTVVAEAGLEDLAATVARAAPGAMAAIATDLPDLPRAGGVQIRLVDDAADLARVAPPGYRVPPWADGVAFPQKRVVAIARRRGSQEINTGATLRHELSHVALYAATSGKAPRWLSEGFAYLHSPELSEARVRTLVGIAWGGEVIPLGDLAHGFPAQDARAQRAYAESYDFVAYLAGRGRYPDAGDDGDRWPFRQLIAHIAAGKSAADAAHDAFGQPLDKLWSEWLESVRKHYFLAPVGLFSLAVWVFGALLLMLAYIRKRRAGRRILASWEEDEDRLQVDLT